MSAPEVDAAVALVELLDGLTVSYPGGIAPERAWQHEIDRSLLDGVEVWVWPIGTLIRASSRSRIEEDITLGIGIAANLTGSDPDEVDDLAELVSEINAGIALVNLDGGFHYLQIEHQPILDTALLASQSQFLSYLTVTYRFWR